MWGEPRGGRLHMGVDLDGELGDPVRAADAGLVVHAGGLIPGWHGYGLAVVINHPDGHATIYAHLSSVAVATGQVVEAGQVIGSVGSTGFSRGTHLHFEVRRDNAPVDPVAWLGPAFWRV